MVKHLVLPLLFVALLPAFSVAQDRNWRSPDGYNEVLITVNGRPITYQQIVGDRDMQAEINAVRQTRRVDAGIPDAVIEEMIVKQALRSYVIEQLLDAEADKMQMKITDTTMRAVLARERKQSSIPDGDDRAWASFVKARYGMTPGEYRERRRVDIRRTEARSMLAGARGPIPADYPVSAYFSLSVSPREIRRQFVATSDRWRISRNIDFEQFKLFYPEETPYDVARKLVDVISEGESCVYARANKGESLTAASEGIKKLIEDQKYAGVRIELIKRHIAKDNTELDADTYSMVQSRLPSPKGSLSDLGRQSFEDEDGGKYQVITFVRVFARQDGDQRNYEELQVQDGIRNALFQSRFRENSTKVEQMLLKNAAIVPEHVLAQ